MSINLSDYTELLETLQPETMALLENTWHDATRVFSPRGLDNYVKGTSALQGLGKGRALVEAWIDEAPQVAKEVGEDVISDLATTLLSLASKTSGAVIELIMSTSTTDRKSVV